MVEALDRIRAVRGQAAPNLGFLAGLRAIDQCQGDIHKAKTRFQGKKDKSKEVQQQRQPSSVASGETSTTAASDDD